MDPIRRNILKAGAVATAIAAAPRVLAQQTGKGDFAMSMLRKGRCSHPLRGGRLRLSAAADRGRGIELDDRWSASASAPFHPVAEFKGEYRCIAADLRNAIGGQSSGPLEIERPWDSYTDDQIGVMDHLGIEEFMVLGFCIGGPFIWNLLKRAPDRVVAAVLAQPSRSRPEPPDLFYENNMTGWGPELVKRRPEITMEMVDKFLTRMYRTDPDFVFTVTRDFVRNCQTPVLILPDDIPAHPYAVAMEAAMLAPKAEVSMFPWKEPKERIPLAVRQIHSFLRAHRPATAKKRDGRGLAGFPGLRLVFRLVHFSLVELVRPGQPGVFPSVDDPLALPRSVGCDIALIAIDDRIDVLEPCLGEQVCGGGAAVTRTADQDDRIIWPEAFGAQPAADLGQEVRVQLKLEILLGGIPDRKIGLPHIGNVGIGLRGHAEERYFGRCPHIEEQCFCSILVHVFRRLF